MDAAALGKRLGRNGFGVPLPVLRSQAELQPLSQHKGSSTCWSPEVVRGADLALQRGPAVPEQPPWGTSEVRGSPSLQAVVLSTRVGELLPCGHSRSGWGAVGSTLESMARPSVVSEPFWAGAASPAWPGYMLPGP